MTHLAALGHDDGVEARVEVSFGGDLLDERDDVRRELRLVCEDIDAPENKLVATGREVAEELEHAGVLDAKSAHEGHDKFLERPLCVWLHARVMLKEAGRPSLSACIGPER